MVKNSGSDGDVFTAVLGTLANHYSGAGSATALREVANLQDPFRVLIATVLSQRTRDEVTAVAEKKLFATFKDARSLAKAHPGTIEKLIRNVGFYRSKARAVNEIAAAIVGRFEGVVPREMDALLSLPMVGRKTANCVLVYGYGVGAIPVDTHVHRISNRLGWVKTKTPEETEAHLSRLVPESLWLELNELMVTHGKSICRPLRPLCGNCPVERHCEYPKSRAGRS